MARTVALTGATGFVGAVVARRLVADGWHVKVLVRSSSGAQRIADLETLQRVGGSLDDPSSLRGLVEACDAIVHCAGAVRGRTAEDFNRVNVEGVARLVDVARQLSPGARLLSLSSLASREPELSHYAASKREGEVVLERLAGPMAWAALRPPAVYGPGDRELLPLFRLMDRGLAPVLASPAARFSLIFVDDLAAAVAEWINQDQPAKGVFELHDGREGGYSWQDVIDIAARRRGGRMLKVPIPKMLLQAVALTGMAAGRISHRPPMLTLGKVRELTHENWVCDNAAFSAATNWTPRIRFEEGLNRTLDAVNRRATRLQGSGS